MHDTQEELPRGGGYAGWKRAMDVGGAAVLLVATLPLWALIIALLALTQGRPIWFRQWRVGQHGRAFSMWKFRTMTAGDPPQLLDRPVAKARRDPRVTPLGRLLRRYGLDELPQLVNVLRGEMSLVGPRPLPVDDLAHPGWLAHVEEPERARRREWFARRQQALPGLTGLWQISQPPEEDFDNWIACDLAYIAHRGLGLDLAIVLLTPWSLLRGRQSPPAAGTNITTVDHIEGTN